MENLLLRLLPDNHEPQELALQQHRLANSILDAANASDSYVFNDYMYSAQLVNLSGKISNVIFLLNGNEIGIAYSPESGMIYFQDRTFGRRIFRECYGFAQITIIFDDEQGKQHVRDTEYIHIMVRKGRQNDAVRRMTEYVYKENANLLCGGPLFPKDVSGLKESAQKTVESHILLLEQISVIYEENYRYFKMNSRFTTITKERIDHFEKLQYISRNTLQYMTQHPEELQQVYNSSGIRVGNFRYQPNKTLIVDTEKLYNIYENRVVLGFLSYLVHEIERIQKELTAVINRVPQKQLKANDYVASSYFIYEKAVEAAKMLLSDVQKLHHRFNSLYFLYSDIFPVKPEIFASFPRFTQLFRSVPQYHQIYDCIVAWFSKGVFTIQEEEFMLSFIKISTLYEIYVLTKMINYFKNAGYSLVSADNVQYPSPDEYYEKTYCNDRFVFKNDLGEITLYYQPVIYHVNRHAISGIGLYRNTSISFPKEDGKSHRGKYYTPDFLIKYKYSEAKFARYLVADAKFSSVYTVKDREVARLAYKYLFSLSTISPDDQIVGLCVFNGLHTRDGESDSYVNIYDYEMEGGISPRADIVTITENATDNFALHEALLRNSIGLFLTEIPQKMVPLPIVESVVQQQPASPSLPADSLSTESPAKFELGMEKLQKAVSKSVPNHRTQKATKKNSLKAAQIEISELRLDKETESRLLAAGYKTAQDLVPNGTKSDLAANTILNRKSRREIEARLKEKKVRLA